MKGKAAAKRAEWIKGCMRVTLQFYPPFIPGKHILHYLHRSWSLIEAKGVWLAVEIFEVLCPWGAVSGQLGPPLCLAGLCIGDYLTLFSFYTLSYPGPFGRIS